MDFEEHCAEDQLLADVTRLNAATVHISRVGAHPEVGPTDPSASARRLGNLTAVSAHFFWMRMWRKAVFPM